ncbi:MAG: histidinol-phosphatase, partial [Burkholderiaceae bacterium]|nr:histidinol-phosphatase [Burkholderiaceae bacterium]
MSSWPRFSLAPDAAETREFIPFMRELTEIAARVIRRYFLTGTEVIAKADASPVTEADRGAEEEMRRVIETRYPD